MSKEETIEVRVQVPKRLLDLLEAEHYFGYSREEFFVSAVKGQIGAVSSAMPFNKEQAFLNKYGRDVIFYHLPEGIESDW